MKKLYMLILFLILIGGGYLFMAIYDADGNQLNSAYDADGNSLSHAYDADGNVIFSAGDLLPVPTGDLTASETIPLPDLYETGKGFTCTGLTSDGTSYYIGDIGTLSGSTYRSQLVVTQDFINVDRTIPLYSLSGFSIIQGVTYDTSDDTLWCCDAGSGKIYHIGTDGTLIGSFSTSQPTGIAYSSTDDTLWVLNYANKIIHMTKAGVTIASYDFAYSETLDQCFLDQDRGYLYITAGTNYTGRNNVYLFDTNTHEQSIACTVDSYSVEGILIEPTRMIIVNDGYYHSASDARNVANIYSLN